jgi:hypothetical protein
MIVHQQTDGVFSSATSIEANIIHNKHRNCCLSSFYNKQRYRLHFRLKLKLPCINCRVSRSSNLLGARFLVLHPHKNSRLPETFQGGHWVPLLLSFYLRESTSTRFSEIFALRKKVARFRTSWRLPTGFLNLITTRILASVHHHE